MERRTRQREAIQRAMRSAGRALSAGEIHGAASRVVRSIGLATVYRTLRGMQQAGEVVTVSLPGDTPRYELAGLGHHHHFHCRGCGRVFEMRGCPRDLSRLAPDGFDVDGHELVLYGRCTRCVA
jgi:Fur family transcriptional regulator, ferric uptake regulator